MIHKSEIDRYENEMELLVEQIGDLKYDSLAQFLSLLSVKIHGDALKDEVRGRTKLAGHLFSCAQQLAIAQQEIDQAWIISEPFMK